jgi:hypothetical protein
LSTDSRPRLAQIHNKLQVHSLVLCAKTEMVEVAYDFQTAVSCGAVRLSANDFHSILHGLVEHRVQHRDVLQAMVLGCCRNIVTKRDTICAAMSGNVCMFRSLIDAMQSANNPGFEALRLNAANYLIENYTSLFKTIGGSKTYQIIEVCMEKGCFARGSKHEIFAMQQLSSIVSGEDQCNHWGKRRTLPDFQRAQRLKLY